MDGTDEGKKEIGMADFTRVVKNGDVYEYIMACNGDVYRIEVVMLEKRATAHVYRNYQPLKTLFGSVNMDDPEAKELLDKFKGQEVHPSLTGELKEDDLSMLQVMHNAISWVNRWIELG